jgi:hypothetical protein
MKLAPAALCAGFCAVAFSQSTDSLRVAITGTSGDRGKCSVEVLVDGVAEVEITGSQARMRTLSGARSAWKRLECNMALPSNPAEFKFTPSKSKRGKEALLHDPAGYGGTAVVRIEDPETGSQSYKFVFEWRGVKSAFEPGLRSGGSDPASQGGIVENEALAGWSGHIEFRGQGEGYYHSYRGTDDLLTDSEVLVERSGRVEIRLMAKNKEPLRLTGRLIKADKNNLLANMSGGSFSGTMEIVKDSRNHIKTLSMTGEGQHKFELRWRSLK